MLFLLALYGIPFVLGIAAGAVVRRWWVVAIALAALAYWTAVCIPGWTETDADGVTGGEWFVVFAIPLGFGVLGTIVGVGFGRELRPPGSSASAPIAHAARTDVP